MRFAPEFGERDRQRSPLVGAVAWWGRPDQHCEVLRFLSGEAGDLAVAVAPRECLDDAEVQLDVLSGLRLGCWPFGKSAGSKRVIEGGLVNAKLSKNPDAQPITVRLIAMRDLGDEGGAVRATERVDVVVAATPLVPRFDLAELAVFGRVDRSPSENGVSETFSPVVTEPLKTTQLHVGSDVKERLEGREQLLFSVGEARPLSDQAEV